TRHPDRPHRVLTIRGGKIGDHLDLDSSTLMMTLVLKDCWIERVSLRDCEAVSIVLENVLVGRIDADDARLVGKVHIVNSKCTDGVSFRGARIGGSLNLAGTTVTAGSGQPALDV